MLCTFFTLSHLKWNILLIFNIDICYWWFHGCTVNIFAPNYWIGIIFIFCWLVSLQWITRLEWSSCLVCLFYLSPTIYETINMCNTVTVQACRRTDACSFVRWLVGLFVCSFVVYQFSLNFAVGHCCHCWSSMACEMCFSIVYASPCFTYATQTAYNYDWIIIQCSRLYVYRDDIFFLLILFSSYLNELTIELSHNWTK